MLYEFICSNPSCLHVEEHIRSVSDRDLPATCSKCGSVSMRNPVSLTARLPLTWETIYSNRHKGTKLEKLSKPI